PCDRWAAHAFRKWTERNRQGAARRRDRLDRDVREDRLAARNDDHSFVRSDLNRCGALMWKRNRRLRRPPDEQKEKRAPHRMKLSCNMLFRRLRERFVTHLIGDYVPVLNLVRRPKPWPTLAALRDYPRGSLGREVAAYLDARALPFKVRYENH